MSREILLLVDALAHEKSVAREIIFEAVEEALASATKKKHKDAIDIKVEIDQESGEYKTFRKWTILPEDLLEDEINFVVQINGKKRAILKVKRDMIEKEILETIKLNQEIEKFINNQKIKKSIFVPNRLINIII